MFGEIFQTSEEWNGMEGRKEGKIIIMKEL